MSKSVLIRLQDYKRSNQTILLAPHRWYFYKKLCQRLVVGLRFIRSLGLIELGLGSSYDLALVPTSMFRAEARGSMESSDRLESVRSMVILQLVQGVTEAGDLTQG